MGLFTDETLMGIVPSAITIDDYFPLSETIQLSIQFREQYVDNLNLKAVVGVHVVERKSEDTCNLSDSASMHIKESPVDSVYINDTVIGFHINEVHNFVIKLTESFQFLLNEYHSTIGDTFYLQDPISIVINEVYQDKLPLIEVFSLQVQEIHDDSFGITESSIIAVKETETENISFHEIFIIHLNEPRPLATAGAVGEFCLG
jgi:hypothetical protein